MNKLWRNMTMLIFVCIFNILFSYCNFAFAVPMYISKDESKESIQKVVYLTFDDGPSINNTGKIIKILKENDVKATFFIIGALVDENPEVFQELYKNNMCIAVHTYSHDYNKIYKSAEAYMEDLQKCNDIIRNITKKNPVSYIRIPGGAYNKVSNQYTMNRIREMLKEQQINYVGWNVCSNDALGRNIPAYKIKDNVIKQSKKISENSGIVVVLMHDSYYKKTTVEALPDIIKYFKDEGYIFKTFEEITPREYKELEKHKILNK
ncbi:polysaccharide deacetylase family protein [Clostridium sp. ZS2-4]|uniref:polysaccharide deacetylase family protein n=1 Tax=Clostridium sp. ZS2-4 TaxID=2987703 RepID=UPI00227A4E18|nr:polysaccharide deacetylase family protein [Clostridium sp. ZS2-4]MCY6355082.1 polysaccharide deacetylase [Clostridium sp. ZS2-4]